MWLVTKVAAAFSTIAWKTLRVYHSAHRPLLIYKRKCGLFGIRKGGIDLVEAMENAHAGFEDR